MFHFLSFQAIKMSEEPKRREWPFFTLMDVYFSDQVNDPTLRLFSSTKRFDTDTLDDTNFEEELKYLPPAAAAALAAHNVKSELRAAAALAAQNAANAAAAAAVANSNNNNNNNNGNGNGLMMASGGDLMDDNGSEKGDETSSFDEPEITINTNFSNNGKPVDNGGYYDEGPENGGTGTGGRYAEERYKHVNQKILQQMNEHHNIDQVKLRVFRIFGFLLNLFFFPQYLLSWRGFHGNMCKGFHTLQRDGQMVDVTIAAGGKIFKAHKLVKNKF